MPIENVRMVSEKGVFNVLDLVLVTLPGPWWWHTEDINDDNAKGAVFRAYREGSAEELAYLLAVDATRDATEPDISALVEVDVQALDESLNIALRKQYS